MQFREHIHNGDVQLVLVLMVLMDNIEMVMDFRIVLVVLMAV